MNDETLDNDVREALEPTGEAVRRLVHQALRPQRPARPMRRLALVAAGALLVVVGAAYLAVLNPWQPAHPQVRMTNVGETVVVKPASGGVLLVGAGGSDEDRLPAGTIIVFKAGERR